MTSVTPQLVEYTLFGAIMRRRPVLELFESTPFDQVVITRSNGVSKPSSNQRPYCYDGLITDKSFVQFFSFLLRYKMWCVQEYVSLDWEEFLTEWIVLGGLKLEVARYFGEKSTLDPNHEILFHVTFSSKWALNHRFRTPFVKIYSFSFLCKELENSNHHSILILISEPIYDLKIIN